MELILFLFIALAAVASALLVILGKNPVYSTLYLVTAFFCIAVLYVMLGAPFIGALQVIVYAGAIMVLFLFVVMLLNLREPQKWDVTGQMRKLLGFAVAGGVLLVALAAVRLAGAGRDKLDPALGSVENVGQALFNKFLLPFEIVSILLLIAIVGVVALLKRNMPAVTKGGK